MKSKCDIPPGHEIRGMMIRLYPSKDQIETMVALEGDLRHAWNWLVRQTEDTLRAREGFAVREGLVPARPVRPDYDGMAPEESKAARKAHGEACFAWSQAVYKATKDLPNCQFRKFSELVEHYGFKHDYQLLGRVIDWGREARGIGPEVRRPGAHMLQSLTKNYFQKSDRRKKRRRSVDPMPLQVRSGHCFEAGDFGERRGSQFYDCQIKINGLTMRGRLPGRAPMGRVLEGVSVRKLADGWWASIKVVLPVRQAPDAVPGSVVGLDVGLDAIVAMSDGTIIKNPRDKVFAERIAGRQAMGKPTGRLELQASRNVRHILHNEVLGRLSAVETIKVEKLPKHIGQMGSSKKSAMRQVVFMLKQKFGDRVREVDPRFTSQDCSQCGHRSKESWSYENGKTGQCQACGYRQNRDVNAARNIAAREPESLASGEA